MTTNQTTKPRRTRLLGALALLSAPLVALAVLAAGALLTAFTAAATSELFVRETFVPMRMNGTRTVYAPQGTAPQCAVTDPHGAPIAPDAAARPLGTTVQNETYVPVLTFHSPRTGAHRVVCTGVDDRQLLVAVPVSLPTVAPTLAFAGASALLPLLAGVWLLTRRPQPGPKVPERAAMRAD